MKFELIDIENFLTIQKGTVKLADRGLVLIQGENEADTSASSNGSGKSTIADALAWCLYGVTARGVSGDDVVNWAAKKGTRVRVSLKDGDDTYNVTRHRKHKTGKNSLTVSHIDKAGTVTELTKGTDKLTQAAVLQIMGASHDVFVGAIYAGQDKMPDLPGMTDKHLKLVVEEASGTTLLERGYRLALNDVTAAKSAVTNADHSLAVGRRSVENAKDALAFDIDSEITTWETKRAAGLTDLANQIRTIVGEVTTLKGQAAAFDKPELERQLAQATAKITASDGERRKERELVAEERASLGPVASTDTLMRQLTEQARTEKTNLDDFDHRVGCPCSGCQRPYTAEDLAPAKDAQKKRLRDTLLALQTAKRDHASALEASESVAQRLEQHRASMTDVSAQNALCDDLRASIRQADDIALMIRSRTERARDFKGQLDSLKTQVNPHLAAKERMEQRIKELEEEVEKFEQRAADARLTLEVAEDTAKVFAPAGARAELLDEVTPFLNSQTAKYLGTLSDGNIHATWSTLTKDAKGNLKERFAIDVVHDLGGESFASISGGEQRKVRIAAALALQDLVASRASKAIDLFVGDEIDNALDPAGVERLTLILEEKAKERGTVLIISHSDLKDWIRNQLIVRKKGRGESVIEEIAA